MKRIAVFTSGGDSPGMNACIRSVVRSGIHFGMEVIGVERGFNGLIKGWFIPMQSHSVSNIIQTGGTILKSARSEEFKTKEGRRKAFEQCEKAGIEGIVPIGGNGTFKGCEIFYEEYGIPSIGAPGTIDNDLYGTDYTIGYDTAVNTALEAVDRIRDTADAHDRLFLVEVMGRDTGFIALDVGLGGGAEAILIPETKTDFNYIAKVLRRGWKNKKTSSVIIVSEGDEEGGAFVIANKLKTMIPQYEYRVSVLGHIQRGGSPTVRDRVLASRLGFAAIKGLMEGKTNVMAGLVNNRVKYTSYEDAIERRKKMNMVMVELAEILSY